VTFASGKGFAYVSKNKKYFRNKEVEAQATQQKEGFGAKKFHSLGNLSYLNTNNSRCYSYQQGSLVSGLTDVQLEQPHNTTISSSFPIETLCCFCGSDIEEVKIIAADDDSSMVCYQNNQNSLQNSVYPICTRCKQNGITEKMIEFLINEKIEEEDLDFACLVSEDDNEDLFNIVAVKEADQQQDVSGNNTISFSEETCVVPCQEQIVCAPFCNVSSSSEDENQMEIEEQQQPKKKGTKKLKFNEYGSLEGNMPSDFLFELRNSPQVSIN